MAARPKRSRRWCPALRDSPGLPRVGGGGVEEFAVGLPVVVHGLVEQTADVLPAAPCPWCNGTKDRSGPARHRDGQVFAGLGTADKVTGVLTHLPQANLIHPVRVAQVLYRRSDIGRIRPHLPRSVPSAGPSGGVWPRVGLKLERRGH